MLKLQPKKNGKACKETKKYGPSTEVERLFLRKQWICQTDKINYFKVR